MAKRILSVILSVVLLMSFGLSLVACNDDKKEKGPFSVVDQAGRTVNFERIPDKIISLAPSNTEIIFGLGLGDKVVGVTNSCDFPEAAKNIDKVGGFATPTVEIVLDMVGNDKDSTVIFGGERHAREGAIARQLETLGYKIVILNAVTFTDLFDSFRMVNKIFGDDLEIESYIKSLENRVEYVTSRVPASSSVTVMHVIYTGHQVAGRNTMQNEIITMAGGINACAFGSGFFVINVETIIDMNPDVITIITQMGTMVDGTLSSVYSDDPLFSVLSAVQNKQVYVVDHNITSRNGPRAVDALEEYAKILYPEIFGNPTSPH